MQIRCSRLRVNSESLCCCPTINPRERIRQKELYSLKLTPWRLVSAVLSLRRELDRWKGFLAQTVSRRGHYGSVYVCMWYTNKYSTNQQLKHKVNGTVQLLIHWWLRLRFYWGSWGRWENGKKIPDILQIAAEKRL